jgi:hypothetical protein
MKVNVKICKSNLEMKQQMKVMEQNVSMMPLRQKIVTSGNNAGGQVNKDTP